jgi:hypothetical protein
MSKDRSEWWLWAALFFMLVEARIGYMTAKADSRHDVVGYGFGLLFIFLPVVLVVLPKINDAVSDWKSRRQWERMHGKPWSESEAAKQQRERGE